MNILPAHITAGDTLPGPVVDLAACPSDQGWTLKVRLVPHASGASVIDLNAVPSGAAHQVVSTATQTALWAPGSYSWTAWVELGEVVYTVATGQVAVLPNPRLLVPGYDGRSETERALDDARAAVRAYKPGVRRYKIGEREMEFNGLTELLRYITHLEGELAREQGKARPGAGGRIYYRQK